MAPVHVIHRATYRRLGHREWWAQCTCGWQRWARNEFDARGRHRDHKHRVIRLSKRKAA